MTNSVRCWKSQSVMSSLSWANDEKFAQIKIPDARSNNSVLFSTNNTISFKPKTLQRFPVIRSTSSSFSPHNLFSVDPLKNVAFWFFDFLSWAFFTDPNRQFIYFGVLVPDHDKVFKNKFHKIEKEAQKRSEFSIAFTDILPRCILASADRWLNTRLIVAPNAFTAARKCFATLPGTVTIPSKDSDICCTELILVAEIHGEMVNEKNIMQSREDVLSFLQELKDMENVKGAIVICDTIWVSKERQMEGFRHVTV